MDQRSDQLNELEDPRITPEIEVEFVTVESLDYPEDETERIKAEIEDTRAELGQTINEIQERLSPEHLMGQVKETVREATIGKVEKVMSKVGETMSNVTEPAMNAMGRAGQTLKGTGYSLTNTVRQNPIACTLVGLGVGMYLVNWFRDGDGRSTRMKRYQAGYGEVGASSESGHPGAQHLGRHASMSSSGEYAGASRQYGSQQGMLGKMKDTAGGFAHDAGEKVSEISHQATEGARWAGRSLQHLMEENPLAVGAAAIAVGAAVGLALPATRMEHEYMGDASEKLVDKVQQLAHDAMDKVKTATQSNAETPSSGTPSSGTPSTGTQSTGTQSTGTQSTSTQRNAGKPPTTGR